MLCEQEIGGYFGLDLPDFGDHFPDMLKYQSARAALRAVLEHIKVSTLLLPAYICNAVIQAVVDAGVQPKFYYLDEHFFPKDLPNKNSDSFLLYVNYFGLNEQNVTKLLELWPKKQLLIDNSQALFAKPTDAIATIYSPRKFLGLPDGGMLHVPSLSMLEPDEEDTESINRMKHLLLRTAFSARYGYSDYLVAEQTLENTKPLAMSQITRRLITSIDLQIIKIKRRENFLIISEKLNQYNSISHHLEADVVPLCYPLLFKENNVDLIKKNMIKNNIFIPTYWTEVLSRVFLGSFEHTIINNCLSVPCDHRYGKVEMIELAENIDNLLNSWSLK